MRDNAVLSVNFAGWTLSHGHEPFVDVANYYGSNCYVAVTNFPFYRENNLFDGGLTIIICLIRTRIRCIKTNVDSIEENVYFIG